MSVITRSNLTRNVPLTNHLTLQETLAALLTSKPVAEVAQVMYNMAFSTCEMLEMEASLAESGPNMALQIVNARANLINKLCEELERDELSPEQRKATAAKIVAAEKKYIEAVDRLGAENQKVTKGREKYEQAGRDIAEFARVHGLVPRQRRCSPFGLAGMDISFPMEGLLGAIEYGE